MRWSVIIPTLDEAATIAATVARTLRAGVEEVIVVDGGSADATLERARAAGARVIAAPRGRGVQQNAGAREARGDALLFLHADTRLPDDFPVLAERTLARPGVVAGAFRFRLDGTGLDLKAVEWMVEQRCRRFQLPYGDQGIFIRALDFRRSGGFPDEPIMEDWELMRRLRRLGRIAIADGDAVTSARRWRRLGFWRTTWVNQLCIVAYMLNIAPERIARWRGV